MRQEQTVYDYGNELTFVIGGAVLLTKPAVVVSVSLPA